MGKSTKTPAPVTSAPAYPAAPDTTLGAGPPPVPPPAPPPPVAVQAPRLDREPAIDVGLAVDLEALTFEPVGNATLAVEGSGGDQVTHVGPMPITIKAGHRRFRASWNAGKRHWDLARSDTLLVGGEGSGDESDPFRVRWKGSTWRGRFKIFMSPRGKMSLAARLPLETYLLGVVPGEIGMLDDSLLEAGRAQAIAARSYTLFYRGRRGTEGFDLYGTVEDQLYVPVESERTLATRCVESTRGSVALSGGQPIRANYCSTCGGITAEVWEAWPAAALPYLVSHPDRGSGDYCAASPQYRWREEWSAQQFVATLEHYGPPQGVPMPPGGPGKLIDVRVDQRSRSGRVWQMTVRLSTGDVVIPAYSLRQVLRRPNHGNAASNHRAKTIGNGNAIGNGAPILRSNLFKIAVRRDPKSGRALAVIASGAGSGHGVGLCQTGALGMARAGSSADRIVTHYYPGVAIERLY
jgi:stage II sporulation protein D